MKLQLNKPLCFFDLETTGTDISKDRIVEMAVLKLHPDGKQEKKEWRINPEQHIPNEVAEIHDRVYELGVHQYSFTAHPEGFVFQDSFELAKIPTWIYEIDKHKIKKEIQFTPNKNQLLIKYT